MVSKMFHHQKDERSFARQPECFQILSERHIDGDVFEIERFHKILENFEFNIFLFADVFADHFLIQTGIFT